MSWLLVIVKMNVLRGTKQITSLNSFWKAGQKLFALLFLESAPVAPTAIVWLLVPGAGTIRVMFWVSDKVNWCNDHNSFFLA